MCHLDKRGPYSQLLEKAERVITDKHSKAKCYVRNKFVFVPAMPFQPSLMFVSEPLQVKLSSVSLYGRLLALPINVKLGLKDLP
jgi:hypothetical protein